MKPSVVSGRRLKILVSAEELSSGGREAVGGLIAAACRQTGFDPGDSRLLIETVPRPGGAAICVTRLPGRRRREGRGDKTEPYIFVFDCLNDALAAGQALLRHPEVLLSDLDLVCKSDTWYLCFSPVLAGIDGYKLDCLLANVGEFGREMPGGAVCKARLLENGVAVASGDAAERLFRLICQAEAPSKRARAAAERSGAPKK